MLLFLNILEFMWNRLLSKGYIFVETEKCKEFRNKVYITAAIVGLALSAIFTIYLMYNLLQIKNKFNGDVKNKKGKEGNQVKPKNI